MLRHGDWRALGTGVRLIVLDGDLDAARAAVERVLDEVDRTYSRFRDDSELMELNASAGRERRVSPLMARALGGALEAAQRTGGAVDPTVGRAMKVIGYDGDFGRISGTSRNLELRVAPVPGWSTIALDARAQSVRIRPGVELDLGSTGKGLAADLAAEAALAAAGPEAGVLVSLGGDITTAGRAPEGGVAIEHGALATSSTTVRRWRSSDGVTVHHIVDPRTGLAAESVWRTATVVAATCEAANAASTAAIVLGEAAPEWLAGAGLPARLVAVDGRATRLGGWPEPEPEPSPGTNREPGTNRASGTDPAGDPAT